MGSTVEEEQRQAMRSISCAETHYEVLGVAVRAKQTDIRARFRKLSLLVHPDKNGSEGARESFEKVQEAYQSLSDEASRLEYDKLLSEGGSARWNTSSKQGATRRPPPPEVHEQDFYYSSYSGLPRLIVYCAEFALTLTCALFVLLWRYCLSWIFQWTLLFLVVAFHLSSSTIQVAYRTLSWALFTARTANSSPSAPRFVIYRSRGVNYLRDRRDWSSTPINGIELEVIYQLYGAGSQIEDSTGNFQDTIAVAELQIREHLRHQFREEMSQQVHDETRRDESRDPVRRERRRFGRALRRRR